MNLQVITYRGKLVTDSRDVAEAVGKTHAHLLRDISNYKEVLDQNPKLDSADFFIPGTYTSGNNQSYPCYLLTKRGCDMVANKMIGEKGILFTATYVTRFEEMENQLKPKLPTTYLEALEELVRKEKENIELSKTIELQAPKVEYFDDLVDRNLLTNFRDTAKELKITQKKFIDWLLDAKYVYRDNKGKLKPYSRHTPGLFELKEWSRNGRADVQTLVTPKGRETFRLLIRSDAIKSVSV